MSARYSDTVAGRGTMTLRERTPETHGYGDVHERDYQRLIHPDERGDKPQPNRSGGARHHVLNEGQFRSAVQRKVSKAGK